MHYTTRSSTLLDLMDITEPQKTHTMSINLLSVSFEVNTIEAAKVVGKVGLLLIIVTICCWTVLYGEHMQAHHTPCKQTSHMGRLREEVGNLIQTTNTT